MTDDQFEERLIGIETRLEKLQNDVDDIPFEFSKTREILRNVQNSLIKIEDKLRKPTKA